jgi:hypothetical protein
MFNRELEIPFQKDVSSEFLDIVNSLRKTRKPGRRFFLAKEPTKDEMELLKNNYRHEIGLLHSTDQLSNCWIVIEGKRHKVEEMPIYSGDLFDICAHYHPHKPRSPEIPSTQDVLNSNPEAMNFVFSPNGLTFYSGFKINPITRLLWKDEDRKNMTRIDELSIDLMSRRFKSREIFLKEMGVNIVKKNWSELTEKPLSNFFKQK